MDIKEKLPFNRDELIEHGPVNIVILGDSLYDMIMEDSGIAEEEATMEQ